MTGEAPVVVLGGGINGAAVARELILNGVPVVVIDRADLASGATAASSRLVHGGLRYLEYADVSLVRESLEERERLLHLAPQFVQPLRFFIPVQHRWTGALKATAKLLRSRFAARLKARPRGLWLIRTGLFWYDRLAHSTTLPNHAVHRIGQPGLPPVDSNRFHWLCSYYDAQIRYPERFVMALLRDAQTAAQAQGALFQVLPYHQAVLRNQVLTCRPIRDGARGSGAAASSTPIEFRPSCIVNATGAWVDLTLQGWQLSTGKLMGGTKGSHFFTRNPALRHALGGNAIYAEAADGRPVFLLPVGDFTMVGTTDLPVGDDPAAALTDPAELEYLLAAANDVFPNIGLKPEDIAFHCCGVRPLPYSASTNPAAITRRHQIVTHTNSQVPLLSLVGGKLTTCRQLGEEVTDEVLRLLNRSRVTETRDRPIARRNDTGGQTSLTSPTVEALGREYSVTPEQATAMWQLCGSDVTHLLERRSGSAESASVPGTKLPRNFVSAIIRTEWCTHLTDLVTRRLMLLYTEGVHRNTLFALAQLMGAQGKFDMAHVEQEVAATICYLKTHHGIDLPQRE